MAEDHVILFVGSVTHAMRAQQLLRQAGIPCQLVRNRRDLERFGCGYGLVLTQEADRAQRLIQEAGIQVKAREEGGRRDDLS